MKKKKIDEIKDETSKPQWLDFDKRTGKPKPSRKGPGSYAAIFKDPDYLLNADSYHRKILFALEYLHSDGITAKEIAIAYKENYPNENKIHDSIDARLSELYTLGLVKHHKDGRTGLWSLNQTTNVNDGQALYEFAKTRQNELKKLSEQPDA